MAEVGTSFDVHSYYSYNEIYISDSTGIDDLEVEFGYCLADNVTMIPTGDLSVAGSSTLEMTNSTVGDYAYIRVNSTVIFTNVISENGLDIDMTRGSRVYINNLTYLDDVYLYAGSILKVMGSTFNGTDNYMELQSDSIAWLTNVVSENGLDIDLYRGSEVYIKNFDYLNDVYVYGSSTVEVTDSIFNGTDTNYVYFRSNSTGRFKNVVSEYGLDLELYRGSQVYMENITHLDDVDVYGGCLLKLDAVNMTSDADIYVYYGQPKLVATNSQLGDYLYVDGGETTLINVTLSDPNLDDGYFYVEYGATAYLDNVTLSHWDYFYIYDGAEAWIMNSNLTGHDSSYFYVEYGAELFVEDTTINFAYAYIEYGSITEFRECDITIDPYQFEVYDGSIAEFYNCHIFANESIWVYDASVITLVDCDVSAYEDTYPPGIYLEDSSSAIIQNTDLDGTLYVSDLPNATIINSILNINYTGSGLNATQWLHLYDSTVNVIDLEIYHLHNHLNASTINMIGNTTYREIRYGISAIVKDDYGQPIQDALVEIYDSLDNLIFSGYTDSNGKSEEIFPALGTYTIKAYADTKEDSSTVTLTNICIEENFTLDITTPVISTVTQDPTTPDYTEDVDVTVEVSDPSGILSVTLYYNNGAPHSTPMSHVSGDLYTGTIPAQAYNTHISYYIVAEDNSQNTATSDTYNYTVIDDTFPSVSITGPTDTATVWGTVTINFTASDDYLTTVLLYIDNEEIDVTGQTSFNWDSTTVGDGSHTIKIIATDEAGNTKETEITVTTTNLARAQEEVDDLEDKVDDLKGSVGTWQGLSAVTFVIGLLIGAAIVFFMKRRST